MYLRKDKSYSWFLYPVSDTDNIYYAELLIWLPRIVSFHQSYLTVLAISILKQNARQSILIYVQIIQ